MLQNKKDSETIILIEQATKIAEKLKIKKILVICESLVVWKAVLPVYAKNKFIIVIPSRKLAENITVETFICDFQCCYPIGQTAIYSALGYRIRQSNAG